MYFCIGLTCSSIYFHRKLELHDEVARHQTEKARIVDELTEVKRQIEAEKSEYEQRNAHLMSTVGEFTESYTRNLCVCEGNWQLCPLGEACFKGRQLQSHLRFFPLLLPSAIHRNLM